jgi:hypothetical protein
MYVLKLISQQLDFTVYSDETHRPVADLKGLDFLIQTWRNNANNKEVKRNCLVALARLSRTHEVFLANLLMTNEQQEVVRKRDIMNTFQMK